MIYKRLLQMHQHYIKQVLLQKSSPLILSVLETKKQKKKAVKGQSEVEAMKKQADCKCNSKCPFFFYDTEIPKC